MVPYILSRKQNIMKKFNSTDPSARPFEGLDLLE
jgi:hypothetical protein